MLVEFSIVPVNGNKSMREEVAEAVKIVDASGLPYQLTPTGTCIEGEWEEVMRVIQQCHDRARQICPYVVTHISIEDEEGAKGKIGNNVASIEQALGKRVRTEPHTKAA